MGCGAPEEGVRLDRLPQARRTLDVGEATRHRSRRPLDHPRTPVAARVKQPTKGWTLRASRRFGRTPRVSTSVVFIEVHATPADECERCGVHFLGQFLGFAAFTLEGGVRRREPMGSPAPSVPGCRAWDDALAGWRSSPGRPGASGRPGPPASLRRADPGRWTLETRVATAENDADGRRRGPGWERAVAPR